MMGIRRVGQWLHEYARLVMFVAQLLSAAVVVVADADADADVCLCNAI